MLAYGSVHSPLQRRWSVRLAIRSGAAVAGARREKAGLIHQLGGGLRAGEPLRTGGAHRADEEGQAGAPARGESPCHGVFANRSMFPIQ